MRSPGKPSLRRDVERLFWGEITRGLTSENAAVAVWRVPGGWQPLVPRAWRHAVVLARPDYGPVPVVPGAGRDRARSQRNDAARPRGSAATEPALPPLAAANSAESPGTLVALIAGACLECDRLPGELLGGGSVVMGTSSSPVVGSFEAAFSVVPEVTHDDLDDAGEGDGEQGAENPGELNPHEDRHNHCKRIEFDCPGQDEWLQNMVLQLLIGHKEDGDHDECWEGVKGCRRHRDDRAEGRADERDEVGESPRIWQSGQQRERP